MVSRGRARLGCAVAALLLVGATACSSSGPTVSPPPASVASEPAPSATGSGDDGGTGAVTAGDTTLSPVTMCGKEGFDEETRRCRHQTSGAETTALYCSFTVTTTSGGKLQARFFHNGRLVLTRSTTQPAQSSEQSIPLHGMVGSGALELPGGDWRCEVDGPHGLHQSASATIEGPTERVSQGTVCDQDDLTTVDGVRSCGEGTDRLPYGTRLIACSALILDVRDTHVDVRLDLDAGGTKRSTTAQGDGPTTSGIIVSLGTFGPAALDIPMEAALPRGDYACVWLVDGTEIGRTPFTIR